MKKPEDCNRYEAFVDGSWIPVHFEQLEPGDIFRRFYPDGKPIFPKGTKRSCIMKYKMIGLKVDVLFQYLDHNDETVRLKRKIRNDPDHHHPEQNH